MGQPHVCPITNSKLMEPFLSTAFDGPRHDDIRNSHFMYGDAFEPNDGVAQASSLGAIAVGTPQTFGIPPAPAVANGSILSIDNPGDIDWYSFSTAANGLLQLSIVPAGLNYEDVPQACSGFNGSCCFGEFTDSARQANLNFEIYASNGSTLLASGSTASIGSVESAFVNLPAGSYRLLVTTAGDVLGPQLYTISTSLQAQPAIGMVQLTPAPQVLGPADIATIEVSVAAAPAASPIAVSLLSRRGSSGNFDTTPMQNLGGGRYRATLSNVGCGEALEYSIEARIINTPAVAVLPSVGNRFETQIGTAVLNFSDNFESAGDWSVSGSATAGQWERGEPLGTGAQPEVDVSVDPLFNCFFTGQGFNANQAGEADVDNGETILTSPAISTLGVAAPYVSYWRWYDNSRGGSPNLDVMRIDLSNDNGVTWVPLEVVGPATNNRGGWNFARISLAGVAGFVPSAQTRFRFIAEDINPGSVVEAALDEFTVGGVQTCESPACPADWNQDGGVDGDDVIEFFAQWDLGNADFNGDEGTDGDDVIAFFFRWDNGC